MLVFSRFLPLNRDDRLPQKPGSKRPKPLSRALVGLGFSLLGLTSALPARALEVIIQPTAPRLGDTVVVTAQLDSSSAGGGTPSVNIEKTTYPMFALGNDRFRAFVPTTPLDSPRRLVVRVANRDRVRNLAVLLKPRSFPTQSIWLPPGNDSLGTDHEFDRVDAFKKLVTQQKFWNGKFLAPNRGPISSGYGIRRYYNGVFAKDYYHRGLDYAGSHGSPVIAPAAGRVALVGRVSQGFQLHGNTIGIDHGQGVLSIFLHLSRIDVKEGDRVRAGQAIGAVGSTGASTGPHLHWGLYVHGLSVDPLPWLRSGFE